MTGIYYTGKQGVQCSRKGRKKIGRYDLLYRQAWKRQEQRQRSRSIWELRFVPQGMEEEDSDFMFLYWIVLLPWWGVFWSEVRDKKFSSLVDGLLTCCILVFIFKIFFVVFFFVEDKAYMLPHSGWYVLMNLKIAKNFHCVESLSWCHFIC